MNDENLELLWHFVRARELVRMRKAAGDPAPWCDDPIIQTYHFRNVRREDDRTTRELRSVVRCQYDLYLQDLPWVYVLGRMFNNADTLRVALRAHADGIDWTWAVREWRGAGHQLFGHGWRTGPSRKGIGKVQHIAEVVKRVQHKVICTGSCARVHDILRSVDGIGDFLAGQVVADLKNDRFLAAAHDKHRFSCPNHAERAGMAWLTPEHDYDKALHLLTEAMPVDVSNMRLTMQDVGHLLGEFNNYMKIRNGQIDARKYRGAK